MVAIILVNYNGAKDTIDCIESLEKINNKNYFIIVVDNSSTDDSYNCLLSFRKEHKFILLRSDVNNGFSYGNNIGIRYALGMDCNYILLLNNDTIVDPDFLDHLLLGFEYTDMCGATIAKIKLYSNPNIIWYGGGNLNKKTARTQHLQYGMKDGMLIDKCEKVSFATGCCLCLKRTVVEKIGLLDERYFLYDEDTEYSFRLQKNGYDIVYVPNAVIYHKVSSSTGLDSPMSQFYSVRNKYFFIKTCYKGISKFLSYLYCTIQFLYRCIRKKIQFKWYWAGLKAFVRNKTGEAFSYYRK